MRPPQEPITIADLVTEARAVDWDFSNWCNASGYDASDPTARRMFECLPTYARSEGGLAYARAEGGRRLELTDRPAALAASPC